jgi:hypothetical protein
MADAAATPIALRGHFPSSNAGSTGLPTTTATSGSAAQVVTPGRCAQRGDPVGYS